jgi:hypothetical protein
MSWIIDYTIGLGIVLYHTLLMAFEQRREAEA